MAKKKAQTALDLLADGPRKEKKPPVQHVTRGRDAQGREVDYIRHEPCGGRGCDLCGGLGFTKQYVL